MTVKLHYLRHTTWVCAVCCLAAHCAAEETPATFPRKLQHILQSRCLSCHNDVDRKGDFSLQSQTSAFRDGYIVPGRIADSHLISVITTDGDKPPAMPKGAEPLTAEEVSEVTAWIESGANWPSQLQLFDPVVDNFDWWSLKPLVRPIPPNIGELSPIDAFVRRMQLKHGLSAGQPANRFTLIRRLTYDLTGLPPSPEEIAAFVADDRPGAYEQLVDRLLASSHYGERWARHWLDVVKYGDTCGYDKDKLRPNAWPYRDYVVRAFNEDKPYSRFVQEQIAGDVLFPGEDDGILGLGFIAAGPWDFIGHVEVPESKIDGKVARNLDRDDMVSNTLNTFCSTTIQCARCHNHKFDPFTQEHYYSLQAVFAAVDRADRVYGTDPAVEEARRRLVSTESARAASIKAFDDSVKQQGGTKLAELDSQIAELTKQAKPPIKQPEFGYHSQIVSNNDVEKSVTIDLGMDVALTKIVLHPCHDEFANIGAGFGFPVRFRVEVASDAREASNTVSPTFSVVGDYTNQDFPNPGLTAVKVSSQASARFVRITATQLAERKNDFILALAEVEVFDTPGRNIAINAEVTAEDSIEAPTRWGKANLTDGIWAKAADEQAAATVTVAQQQRTSLLKDILTPEKVAERDQLDKERGEASRQIAALPQGKMVYAATTDFTPQGNFNPTKGVPRSIAVLHRGNIQQPKQLVSAGTIPLSRDADWLLPLSGDHAEGDRRAALARWVTDPNHPLTWRSIVNRIWQYHFGKGIVASPNDFGRMGLTPTHPELLDWLADEFRATQSFKHLHRLIVTSSTYRQQSALNADNAVIDSDNQFLWRMNRRRLSAEEVRDSVLAVSGCLKLEAGGPGYYLFALEKTAHSPHYEYHKFDPADENSHRRSIYRFIVRSQPDPFMTTLDCADSSQSTPLRTETLTSLQALSLFNNKFTLTMAERFAERVESEASQPDKTARAFQLTTGRMPSAEESSFLENYASAHGLHNLCRVLLNASEFVFVD
jgi:hypothetical protein